MRDRVIGIHKSYEREEPNNQLTYLNALRTQKLKLWKG
jgi:hypothetical protein